MNSKLKQMPLWRDANRLLILIEDAVRHFPRYHKYILGSDLGKQAININRWIARAVHDKAGRAQHIKRLIWPALFMNRRDDCANQRPSFPRRRKSMGVLRSKYNDTGSPTYEPIFIHDSYSNRKKKGARAAVERLQQCMRKVSCNGKKRAFFLQLDILNFFNCIDRTVLLRFMQSRLHKSRTQQNINANDYQDIMWLFSVLLNENAAKGAVQRGSPASFDAVPTYKRLMYAPKHCGLAIGNLTSQFFANVYLNELDQYIKHHLKCHYYLRYVDDFVLLYESETQLLAWREGIQLLIAEKLDLELKELAMPKTIASGCDFLGYVTRPHYRLVRQRVLHHCLKKLADLEDTLLRKNVKGLSLGLGIVDREALQAMLASYFSYYQHASSFHLQQQLVLTFPWLKILFEFRVEDHGKHRLYPKWQPKGVCSFQSQWNWFAYHFVGFLQLIPLGKCFACRASDKIHLPAALQKIIKKNDVLYAGMDMYVVGLCLLKGVRSAHIFVAEQGYLPHGTRSTVDRLCAALETACITIVMATKESLFGRIVMQV